MSLSFSFVCVQEDKLDMSTPKMYSSFIPNGQAEPHLHTPVHQGLPLGDPDLSLSQVGQLVMECSLLWIKNKKYISILSTGLRNSVGVCVLKQMFPTLVL